MIQVFTLFSFLKPLLTFLKISAEIIISERGDEAKKNINLKISPKEICDEKKKIDEV
jgi:hypothetical protein